MERKRLVLDANILIRACFGRRVRFFLANHADKVNFFVAQATLQSLLTVVQVVDDEWLAHAEVWAA